METLSKANRTDMSLIIEADMELALGELFEFLRTEIRQVAFEIKRALVVSAIVQTSVTIAAIQYMLH